MSEPTSRIEDQLKGKDIPFLGSRIEKLIAGLDIGGSGGGVDNAKLLELIEKVNELQAAVDGIDLTNFLKKNVDFDTEGHIQEAGYQLKSQLFVEGNDIIAKGFPSVAKTSIIEGWQLGWGSGLNSTYFYFGSTSGPDADGIYSNCTLMSKSFKASNVFCINFAKTDGTYRRIEFNPDELAIKVYEGGIGTRYLVNTIDLRTLGPYDDSEIINQLAANALGTANLAERIETLENTLDNKKILYGDGDILKNILGQNVSSITLNNTSSEPGTPISGYDFHIDVSTQSNVSVGNDVFEGPSMKLYNYNQNASFIVVVTDQPYIVGMGKTYPLYDLLDKLVNL